MSGVEIFKGHPVLSEGPNDMQVPSIERDAVVEIHLRRSLGSMHAIVRWEPVGSENKIGRYATCAYVGEITADAPYMIAARLAELIRGEWPGAAKPALTARKYRLIPREVEAHDAADLLDTARDNPGSLPAWFLEGMASGEIHVMSASIRVIRQGTEGFRVAPGDVLVRLEGGELTRARRDDFRLSYEPVPEAAPPPPATSKPRSRWRDWLLGGGRA